QTSIKVEPTTAEVTEIEKENIEDLTFTFKRFKRILRYLLKHNHNIILPANSGLQQIVDAFNKLPKTV
ncbi:MAG: hypothetical protein WC389_19770, partial [Lutibacter sp.]